MTVTVAAVSAAPPAMTPGPVLAPGRPPGGSMLAAAQAALPLARGQAALLLPPARRIEATAARRRMAEAILRDAAAAGGGVLLRSAAGGTLLLGVSPGAAARAASALGPLAGEAEPASLWQLPAETGPVLAWAAAQAPPPPALPPPPAPPLAGLYRSLDAMPAETVLRAETLLSPTGEALGRRLHLSRTAIAAALGPLAEDADLLALGEDRLAARLLPGLGAWAQDLPGLRLIPLPREGLPPPAGRAGAVGVLPLALAAEPEAMLRWRALAGLGWALALEGLEAATLALLDPAGLPADWLLLRWSPALAADALAPALQALGPGRVVLTGCDRDPAALALARRLGLRLARAA